MGIIRPATEADASSLTALAIEVWFSTYIKQGVNAHFADYALAHFTPDRFKGWIEDPHDYLNVSQNSDGIDGYIHVADKRPDPVVGQISMELVSLYVQPRHHRAGIGIALLGAVDHLRPFWLAVNCENAVAQAFYAAQGCSKIGQADFEIGDAAYPNDILLAPDAPSVLR